MKNILPKVSLLACLGLLFAGSTLTGFSQGCNPGGYGGYQDADYYCIPAAPALYSSRNYTVQDDWGQQGYSSRNPYRDSYTQNRSPRRNQYGYSDGNCQCDECIGSKGEISYSSPSRTDDSVNARLNYIESILTFILSHLGFDDKFSAKSKGTPVNPTRNQAPQGNCAGGT